MNIPKRLEQSVIYLPLLKPRGKEVTFYSQRTKKREFTIRHYCGSFWITIDNEISAIENCNEASFKE